MALNPAIDVTAEQRKTLLALLAKHLPNTAAWVYGSRAKWTSRPQSDLDMVVFAAPQQNGRVNDLREAFEESNLPFRVDLFVWDNTPEQFRKQIEAEHAVLVENGNQYAVAGRPTVTLGDCAVLVRETVSPSEMGDAPYIGLEHIGENTLSLLGHGAASDVTSAKARFRQGDILFGKLRPYFRKIVRAPFGGICSTDIWVVRSKNGVDQGFLHYCMASQEFVDFATSGSEGTRMPRAKWEYASQYRIPLPPLREQRAIARILGTLDDKIELNRRMNETLEAMARALFRSWFVDFDPVRAKMAGRDPALPPAVAALFPNRMVNSELGQIPEGWQVKALGDELSDLVSGQRPRGGAVNVGVPSIGAENVIGLGVYNYASEKYVPADFFARLRDKGADVRDGDVLLYKDGASIGRKTYFGCGFPHAECAVNEHVFILRLRDPEAQRYLFFWLDQPWMTQRIIALNSNSAQPGINKTGVRGLPLLLPPPGVLAAFDAQAGAATDKIFANCRESRKLAALRDILLPKLMSGELRTPQDQDTPSTMTEHRTVAHSQ